MRIFKDEVEYQGTPEEIAEFMRLHNPVVESDTLPIDPYAPFEEVLTESEELRKKLAADPNYSPYPGVVPSKESEPDVETTKTLPTAEKDTGVEYI